MKKNFKFYRLNYQISAPTLRLVDETGKQIGLVTKEDALKQARIEEKDFVEIAPLAKPPVVKLIDFKKFKYLEAKKERGEKKKAKSGEMKEIRLSPFIGKHDLDTRLSQGKEFLQEGNQLKIVVKFQGREITHKEFGFEVLNKYTSGIGDLAKVVRPPHFEGRLLVVTLTPVK
ncbi:translation initiation factor IF-3, partial [Candidatus Gottesmanbacteria bacterium]|nr:translation initiation factor IF-3 [Candidatus Gottesmanbacteria bacterium]